jgi:hypothetical protein
MKSQIMLIVSIFLMSESILANTVQITICDQVSQIIGSNRPSYSKVRSWFDFNKKASSAIQEGFTQIRNQRTSPHMTIEMTQEEMVQQFTATAEKLLVELNENKANLLALKKQREKTKEKAEMQDIVHLESALLNTEALLNLITGKTGGFIMNLYQLSERNKKVLEKKLDEHVNYLDSMGYLYPELQRNLVSALKLARNMKLVSGKFEPKYMDESFNYFYRGTYEYIMAIDKNSALFDLSEKQRQRAFLKIMQRHLDKIPTDARNQNIVGYFNEALGLAILNKKVSVDANLKWE